MKRFKLFFLLALFAFTGGMNVWAASDLSALNVFPNPVRVYNGDSAVNFDNVTEQLKLVVFDLNGRTVRELEIENSGGRYVWDLSNDEGSKVASGVYFYVVANHSGEKRRGKLAIIR